MTDQILTWVLTLFGILGFELAGRKKWWAWYVNLANQVLWIAFALISGYPAFLVGAIFYTLQFGRNAYKWTREHREFQKPNRDNYCYGRWDGGNWVANACTVPGIPHEPHDIPKEDQGWDFNRVAVPNVELFDADTLAETYSPIEERPHPLVPKFQPEDPSPSEVLCTGRPRHVLCEMPILAHKPHMITLPDISEE